MAKKKETPEAEPVEKPVTQRVAVQKALDAGKVLPVDGVPYVFKEFGITLSNQAFSTIKSKIATAGKKAKRAPRAVAVPAAARSTTPVSDPTGLAIQVEAIKALVDLLGVDQVVSIAKLFVK